MNPANPDDAFNSELSRRRFLRHAAWAGAAVAITISGGVVTSKVLHHGSPAPMAEDFTLDLSELDRLVDGMLITEAGRKAHLDQDPEVQLRLRRYEDRLIQEAYLNRAIKAAETEDQLKARYQTFAKEKAGREEVHARHILVKTEAEAKAIIAELDKGADFAELAKEDSTDPGGKSGGDLGYFGHDDMVKEVADTAFALPAGQYTKAPVKTEFGWHVIKVEDHRVSTPPSFDEARQEVSQLVAHDVVDAKLKELRSAAKVETYGLDGKPLPTSAK